MAEAAPDVKQAKPGLAVRVKGAAAGIGKRLATVLSRLPGHAAAILPYWRHRSWRRVIVAVLANAVLIFCVASVSWLGSPPRATEQTAAGHEPAGHGKEAAPHAPADGAAHQASSAAAHGESPAPAQAPAEPPPRWLANAGRFDAADPRPRVAVIVSELGPSKSLADLALRRLTAGFTFAVQPAIGQPDAVIAKARAAGHETMLMLPMEAVGFPYDDPGPRALLVNLTSAETGDRIDWLLARSMKTTGFLTYQGSRYKADALALVPLLERLKGEDLLIVDDGGAADSVLSAEAAKSDVPALVADSRLDLMENKAGIDAALTALEQTAKARGSAIGVIRPSPLSIERLAVWQAGLDERGIALAPLSAVWLKRAPSPAGGLP